MIRTTQKSILWVILLTMTIVFTPCIGRAVEPCPLPSDNNALLDLLWPMFDTNKDGGLSKTELSAIYTVPDQYFNMLDTNKDGKIDRVEFQPILALLQLYLPGGLLSIVDTNGNQLIEFQEVSGYVSQQQFQLLDRNKNGVIDCGDIGELPPIEGEPGVEGDPGEEGEIIIEGEPPIPVTDPCDWVDMALEEFANLDQNQDGVLTRDELNFPIILIYPPIVDFDVLFDAFDLDGNGRVTKEELKAWKVICGGEGEDEMCPLPAIPATLLLEILLPLVDSDGNGKLSKDEVRAIYADIDNLLSQYNLNLDLVFLLIDSNRDGGVDISELDILLRILGPQLGIDPDNLLTLIDTNKDGLIAYEEVSEYVTAEQFAMVDFNGNDVIDCNDLEYLLTFPPIDWEGELPFEGEIPIPDDPCLIGPILLDYFNFLDRNQDGKLSADDLNYEIILPIEIPVPINEDTVNEILMMFDIDADGAVTQEEIQTILANCEITIEGDPSWEGEVPLPTDPCIIAPLVLQYFDMLDTNKDGGITLEEVLSIPVILGGNTTMIYPPPFPIDPSIIREIFILLDLNADGKIIKDELKVILNTCSGEPPEGEPSPEGEIIIFPDIWNPCALAPYAIQMFNTIDQNKDGVIDINEIITSIASVYMMPIDQTWLSRIVSMLDLDNNGVITLEELQAIVEKCNAQSNETGGPGPGGNEPPTSLILERAVSGNRRYWPGQTLTVILTIRNPIRLNVSALGLKETLPTGWVLQSVVESSNAVVVPSNGATGTLEFAWMDIPPFPVKVVYNVAIPNDADGQAVLSGYVLYRTVNSEELSSPVVDTVLLKGWSPDRSHSADSNRDWAISLTEMLRVIQMFNYGGYGCDDTSEDGYGPGEGKHRSCMPHACDYRIQDWKIDLSELLRLIQLYNAPGKGYILQEGTEDGFAPLLN